MKIVFFSLTGQTRRFIQKTGLPNVEITQANPFFEILEPFILVVPTYDEEITEPIWDFLTFGNNLSFFKGVVGGGNRNFADLFIFTAKDIAKEFHVPLLYEFEFSGTTMDVENMKKVVREIEFK
ncbi:MAG: class Ib ribonucleoside-diphosphate reductase assembly flavoprotein NrdI [Streptococcaceae bacterium]|jgi:protein involved in ribonucleotide reduction|nr:class Ib ribonucleoside-diphosphate reductase assembly flavoprotein NrdI [Streptococcaceae bacterium]